MASSSSAYERGVVAKRLEQVSGKEVVIQYSVDKLSYGTWISADYYRIDNLDYLDQIALDAKEKLFEAKLVALEKGLQLNHATIDRTKTDDGEVWVVAWKN